MSKCNSCNLVLNSAFEFVALLDFRFGPKLKPELQEKYIPALRRQFQRVYDELERTLEDIDVPVPDSAPQNNNAGVRVASSRLESVGPPSTASSERIASAWGLRSVDPRSMRRTWQNVDKELESIGQLYVCGALEMTADPMQVYREHTNMKLACSVAADVLSVPSGEAPSERVFSITTHIVGKRRTRLSPEKASQLTFVKKNYKVLQELKRLDKLDALNKK